MTVNDLIATLLEIAEGGDGESIVMLAKDPEGNGFSELGDYSFGAAEKDGYSWEFGESELTPDLVEQGYTEEDIVHGEKAVCFWP